MSAQRRVAGDIADVAFGLTQSSVARPAGSVIAELAVVPGRMAYMQIPAAELREFADSLFPHLATNRLADITSGLGHRYRAGHDLLLDVPITALEHGPWVGLKHAGHIVLTDFPTRAGIPIPGFSQAGIGQLLESAGISSGWLQLSVFDTGIGLFAFAEGASTLAQALSGTLEMDLATACQTFGTGSVEVALAVGSQNPLLLAGGLQDVLAGLVSTWTTVSVYVDPLDFFGTAATSALLGLGLSYGLTGKSLSTVVRDSAQSGVIGALYSVSLGFGFGALAGLAAFRFGRMLAERHNSIAEQRLAVDEHAYRLLVKTLCGADSATAILAGLAEADTPLDHKLRPLPTQPYPLDHVLSPLPTRSHSLDHGLRGLPSNSVVLDSQFAELPTTATTLDTTPATLPSAPLDLARHYQEALAIMNKRSFST